MSTSLETSTPTPQYVSTDVVASVFECHEGAQILGFVRKANPETAGNWARGRTIFVSHDPASLDEETRQDTDSEEAITETELHLKNLIYRSREQRMRYLSECGMEQRQIDLLIRLVSVWLNQDEILRLDALSRSSTEEIGQSIDLFARWINSSCLMRLVTLLHESELQNHRLAAAYAFSHALLTAAASFRPGTPTETKPLVLTPDDDLG